MPRLTRDGRPLKRLLEWALNRDVMDGEIATAIEKPLSTFSRYKHTKSFPSFEELEMIGEHFGINPRWLQVEFEFLGVDEVSSSGNLASPPGMTATKTTEAPAEHQVRSVPKISELPIRGAQRKNPHQAP